jgi:outer membrane lipoprotein-sorting protein
MRDCLAGLILSLAASGPCVLPAAAEPNAGEILFAAEATVLRPKRAQGAAPTGPAALATAGFNLSSPPLAPSFQPWNRPARSAAAEPKAPTAAAPEVPLPPLPPRAPRPAPSGPAAPETKPQEIRPVAIAAPPTPPAAKPEPLTEREIVDRANAFFNGLGALVAEFTQIGGDGRRLTGTLYLQRPGKVRFEYDRPATIEVVADGSSVAVRDTKLATQDLYSISQTPLKFLLRERVNLGQDIRITDIAQDGDSVRVTLEDKSTLGGTSRITLYFDPRVEDLTQWRIVDAQGFLTTVMLSKVQRGRGADPSLFVIHYDRAIPDSNK